MNFRFGGWCGAARVVGLATALACGGASAFTVFSDSKSLGGPGVFYGPGKLPQVPIFDVTIRNVTFAEAGVFVTPYVNNGAQGPFTSGQLAVQKTPNGFLSDNATTINVNADTGPFDLNGMTMLTGIAGGSAHGGEQLSVMYNGTMIMTMDMGLDMGIGEAGVMKVPFYGTTGEVTVPLSLQTQMGVPGGIDRAGPIASGTKMSGRIGDADGDGFIDGSLVVAGNMPLTSIFMPGAPYLLIRNFQTDMPVDGQIVGTLLGSPQARQTARAQSDLRFPEDLARFAPNAPGRSAAADAPVRTAAVPGARP
ncbi:MAG: hypothetical protein ACK6C0_15115 [Betaproteobacteria bacterium]